MADPRTVAPARPGRPKLLDLFSKAGGAGTGYERAGFDVHAVDIEAQPNSPHPFYRADAVDIIARLLSGRGVQFEPGARPLTIDDFAVIHASPPCQGYLNLGAVNRALGRHYEHPRMIATMRSLLRATGLPYVIENVADAKRELVDPVRICGTGLGLPLRRHRLFESNLALAGIACAHHHFTEPKYWTSWRPNGEHRLSTVVQVYGNAGGREHWPAAMGIDWMTPAELVEAVPPAYTEHIGAQLITQLTEERAA